MVFGTNTDLTKGAKYAVMIDYATGDVLYEKKKDEKTKVASLTKMMGLILIFEKLESSALKTDEILTTSKNAKEMGGTQIWLEEGEKISVNDLIKGIVMASANDAMVLMAERISGTEEEFVKEMNQKAKDLGLKNTNFVNSTGLDEEGSYSTASDMAIIAKELLKHKKVLDYSSKYEDYIRENTDNKTWIVNTNKLVKFYEGVDGLKTGYTDEAGSSICVTAEKDGLRLIALSFGYNNAKTRNSEMMSLLDYGFNQYTSKTILKQGTNIKTINLNKANKDKIDLILKEDLKLTLKKGESEKNYTYSIKLDELSYPIKKGDKIGAVYLKNGSNIITESDLITNTDILKAGFLKQYKGVLSDMFTGIVI